MRIGVMNDPSIWLFEEVDWISKNNFDFVDLTLEPPGAYEFNIRKMSEKLKNLELEAIGHTNPFLPAIHPLKSIREACLKEFKKYVQTFKKMGISLMNVHPYDYGPIMNEDEKVEANIELIKEVHSLCVESNITLMLENGKPLDAPHKFQIVLDRIPEVMVHLDIGHANIAPKNLTESFFKRFKKKIVHLHISDNRGYMDDHLPLGCGNIDWKQMVRLMKSQGYDGTITLEIFSKEREYVLSSRRIFEELWRKES